MKSLIGRNIVLTGANSGIGFEILKILLGKGNRVLAVDLATDRIATIEGDVIPMVCDISSAEGVDNVFAEAEKTLSCIDVFIANAGFAYYEKIEDPDWNKISKIFDTNVISVAYSYQRFVKHLSGRDGIFAVTCSGMGIMGMPGFALYSSTKFAINGLQDSLRFESPDNLQLTVSYPVAVNTRFFETASEDEFERPYPVQKPDLVARKIVRGMEKGKKKVFPSKMFRLALVLFTIFPPIKWLYLRSEKGKFKRFLEKKA